MIISNIHRKYAVNREIFNSEKMSSFSTNKLDIFSKNVF